MQKTTDSRREDWPTARLGLHDEEVNPYADLSPAERVELVWPLTVQAWSFLGKPLEFGSARRVVGVRRLRG